MELSSTFFLTKNRYGKWQYVTAAFNKVSQEFHLNINIYTGYFPWWNFLLAGAEFIACKESNKELGISKFIEGMCSFILTLSSLQYEVWFNWNIYEEHSYLHGIWLSQYKRKYQSLEVKVILKVMQINSSRRWVVSVHWLDVI